MTDQLEEWRGHFGSLYHNRNRFSKDEIQTGSRRLGARMAFWHHMLSLMPDVKTVFEPGCGTGNNFIAMKRLGDRTKDFVFTGCEPHPVARNYAKEHGYISDNALPDLTGLNHGTFDLVYTMGLLIHILPAQLKDSMDELFRLSNKYILMAEYFAPELEECEYHTKSAMLWKRDFGLYLMNNYDVDNLGYGFCWKPLSGLDNLTWWIFRKRI